MMDSLPSLSLIGKLWYQKSENSPFEIFLFWTDSFSCNSWWGICWILAGTSRRSWWGTRYDFNFIIIIITIFEVFLLPGSILKHTKAYISSTNLTLSLCLSSRASSNVTSDSSYTTKSSPPLLPSSFDLSLPSTVNHPWTSKSKSRPWNNIFFLLYRNYLRPNSDAYFAFKRTSYTYFFFIRTWLIRTWGLECQKVRTFSRRLTRLKFFVNYRQWRKFWEN